MRKTYQCGRTFVSGQYRENVNYDVCSNDVHVRFDGKGGITEYSLCNQSGSLLRDCTMAVFINGEMLDPFCPKKVKLVGRTETITVRSGDTQIEIFQFVAPTEHAVFYEIKTNKPGDYDFALDLNHSQNGFHFDTNADVTDRYVDENMTIYMHTRRNARLVLSYDPMMNCKRMIAAFDAYKKQVEDEIKSVRIPASAASEKDKAIYLSGIFCALENYKEFGLFKGFSVGARVGAPIQTDFRDAYWTVLCLYRRRPDLVRNQILTLAHGIDRDGSCPSGVAVDYRLRSRNYYDSPSFFVLTVYDYLNRTGEADLAEM